MKQELKTIDNNFISSLTRPLFKEDKEAYTIKIKTADSSERVHVTAFRQDGITVSGTGLAPDESGFSEYTLSNEMYSKPGKLTLRVAVISGNSMITVREIECKVMEDING